MLYVFWVCEFVVCVCLIPRWLIVGCLIVVLGIAVTCAFCVGGIVLLVVVRFDCDLDVG